MRKVMQLFGDTLDFSYFRSVVIKTCVRVKMLPIRERPSHIVLDKFGGYGKIAGQLRIVTL